MALEPLSFDIVDAIKFFGALVSTPDVSVEIKDITNGYIKKLVESLEKDVNSLISSNSNIKVIKSKL